MRLRSLQLSHSLPVLIEHYHQWLRVYYADGHYEMLQGSIRDFTNQNIYLYKYKNPVTWGTSLMHPTQDRKDQNCQWINLDYLEEKDSLFINLLKQKNLLQITQNMYLKYKRKIFVKEDG